MILLITGLYVLIFLDDYLVIAALIILILYFHKDIVEILKYHGAEHKCINMYESTNDLSTIKMYLSSKEGVINSCTRTLLM